jgi:patatin-like phospholipase/acyl hydrolase
LLRGDVPTERFQILSLDGGGVRGLFSAAVLAAIEEDLQVVLTDHFDLIAGTSTGGIIALGLGLGMRPREIVDFYLKHAPAIFRNPGRRTLRHWVRAKYPSEPLVEALRHALGERPFGESTKRLVIPSYDIGEDDVHCFRTPHHERLRRDYRLPAWKVALATASAPTYFPACREVDRARLIDGGVWANNPAMVALVEAVATLQVPIKHVSMLSLGTYDPVAKRHRRVDGGGKVAWLRDNAAIDVVLRAQSIGIANHVRLLLGGDRVLRIDPKVPPQDVSLDNVRGIDELIARAAHHSRILMPAIKERFTSHKAASYEPLYRLGAEEERDAARI